MDSARNKFLARPSLTQDADARLARRNTLELSHQPPHGLALPHNVMLPQSLA